MIQNIEALNYSSDLIELSNDEVKNVAGGNPVLVYGAIAFGRWAAPRVAKAVIGGFVGGAVAGLLRR